MRAPASILTSTLAAAALAAAPFAQGSQHSLSLDGAGAAAEIPLDDNAPGAASSPTDVGAGDFTLELWVRGLLADNPTASAGGDVELPAGAWLAGNVLLDRSAGKTGREFGVSVAGGLIRFGTGTGDAPAQEAGHTLEGSTPVLDGGWHHVAVTRDATTGEKRIYVDGALDVASSPASSTVDLSYPDDGTPGGGDPLNPFLVVGASKDGLAGFDGSVDELRIWTHAVDEGDVLSWYDRVAVPILPELAGDYRFEAGAGAVVANKSLSGSPDGALVGGFAWRSYFAAPADTAPISVGLLPYGFHRERRLTGLIEPTCLQALPDGRFLIAERAGKVLLYDGSSTTTVLQVTADLSTIEYGIVGLELDPGFLGNGWFYLHYTTTELRDRVSRFTFAGDAVDPASEFIVWENADLGPGHTGGSMSFGPDGKIYIPTGDGFFPPNSQDLTNANGKVLRLNPDGTIPPDNPGVSIPGADPAIWAWGLRNPFRSGWDLISGTYWIADVGGDDAMAWEELHVGVAGANYGWPDQEGPECVVADCTGMVAPEYGYRHDDPLTAPTLVSGSITGGVSYYGNSFPADFHGNYIFGDYANRWMRRLRFDGAGNIVDAPVFIPILLGGTLVELDVDPAGALWYVTVGLPWTGGPDEPSLYRVGYTAPGDPTPVSTIVLDTSPSGLLLNLDGYAVTTPFAFQTREGYVHEVDAPANQLVGGITSVDFLCWSDGEAIEHELVAPAGGMNVTASYGSGGAVCDDGCGFSTYGHGAGGVNTLGLVGGSGASVGGTLVTKTTGLDEGATVWVGVALNDWDFPLLGGTVLVDSFSQFATVVLGTANGESVWSVGLPNTPSVAGATFYMQSLATDAGTPFGLAYSNGLKLTLCP
ncbi:MAG: PQQ-dependent sugar dehydrogenase [Planctomycetota bacterium]